MPDPGKKQQTTIPIRLDTFELLPGTSLIEASAGTGKTYTIQFIVLDLLLKGIGLEEILLVTFTEAATKELKDRLQAFLAKVESCLAERQAPDDALRAVIGRAIATKGIDEVRRRVRRALLHVDEASVFTIHGFCQRALSENAFAADSPFDTEVCTDTGTIIETIVRDLLREVNLDLTIPLPPGIKTESLMKRAQVMTGVLRIRNPYTGALEDLPKGVDSCVDALQSCAGEVDAIVAELLKLRGDLKANIYKEAFFDDLPSLVQSVVRDPLDASADDRFVRLTAEKIGSSLKKSSNAEVPDHRFFQLCDELLELREAYAQDFLRWFDTRFVELFERLKEERGLMTYEDMILKLARAVRSSALLRAQMRRRYRAAIVDEFQDTDARQYEIFRRIFGEVPDDGGDDRYFAMIGDPKQSIYSFRGADVDAYLEARADADHRYTLTTNYRSEESVVGAVNQFFEGTRLGESPDQNQSIEFQPVTAAPRDGKPTLRWAGELSFPGLFERMVHPGGSTSLNAASDAAIDEAAKDIAKLLGLAGDGKLVIESRANEDRVRRAVHSGDIAVLVNAHREAERMQERLRELQIVSVRGKSGDVFATGEARDFLRFLETCLVASERNLNALLVCPLYGKTDTELKNLPDSERQAAYELFNVLGSSWKEGASVSLIWTRFLERIDARARLLRRFDGERLLTNYLHVSELVQQLERSSALSPERLTDRVRDMVRAERWSEEGEGASEANLVRLESDERAVKILTLHASKGLEFPIVFLPTLWRRAVRPDDGARPILDPADPDCLVELSKDAEHAATIQTWEALRLGYVAMTRAVHLCFYYNALTTIEPAGYWKRGWFDHWMREQRPWTHPEEGAFDALIESLEASASMEVSRESAPKTVQPRSLPHGIDDAYQITSYTALSRQEKRPLSAADDPSVRGGMEEAHPRPEGTTGSASEASTEPGAELLLPGFPPGTRTGLFVHELFEHCETSLDPDAPMVVERIVRRYFPETGESQMHSLVQDAIEMLRAVFESKRPLAGGGSLEWLRVPAARRLHELEFYFPVEGVDMDELDSVIGAWALRQGVSIDAHVWSRQRIDGFLTGSIDLLFELDGRFHILDWKTNMPLEGMPKSREAYDAAGMHQQMCHGNYYLQALIYTVAVESFLTERMGDRFDWAQHMGGFVYAFVRGLAQDTGWLTGQFSRDEVERARRALGTPKSGGWRHG